ncbi:MAG TPA: suppressor of fused domain protein [Pirellulales bacterium]|jgi:hypothetical protein|nr:suppressor of fused domain protein [Pirellulales bacterium]
MTDKSFDPRRTLFAAIVDSDENAVAKVLDANPQIAFSEYPSLHGGTWLHLAAGYGSRENVRALLQAGCDLNAVGKQGETPLSEATADGQLANAEYLIEQGALAKGYRILIRALNQGERAFDFVKLLVDHGVDLTEQYKLGADDDETAPYFTALSWAIDHGQTECADYLRAHGAVMPLPPPKVSREMRMQKDRDKIIEYIGGLFGPVRPRALVEIVPTSPVPIAIHVIPPTKESNFYTLFTTGMSDLPQRVPRGQEAYEYTELVMFLPPTWPMNKDVLAKREHGWPLYVMRQIANYPHLAKTWLGGRVTILAQEEPPQPYAPGCPFAAMLLAANLEDVGPIALSGARQAQVYTMLPLYPEERQFEMEKGIPALFQGFERHDLDRIVDLHRPNVAVSAG